jgi:hypothetical protein
VNWAFNRLGEVHDIHVPLCRALLGEFSDPKYKYRHQITRQYMLASGAFLIENPDKAVDVAAMNTASVGSVLKVYSAILQQKPDARSKLLDDLLKKQSQGKLDEALGKECKYSVPSAEQGGLKNEARRARFNCPCGRIHTSKTQG